MTDIFISYVREDLSRIEPLADALAEKGWSVWWDRDIPAGTSWREVIGDALENARSILVVWSNTSVKSRWVQEEADWGLERKILIPIYIERVRPPLGFRTIQTIDLVDWEPSLPSFGFAKLISDLEPILGPAPLSFKDEMRKKGGIVMPGLKTYDLFISHSWAYGDAYEKFCNLLNAAPNFYYRNYSIPKDDPVHTNGTDKELYQAIKRKISATNIVIIMAGVYSTYSKWIRKEMDIAVTEFSDFKPILGVKPWANRLVSDQVRKSADELVGWNTDSIVGAIRRLSI